jgi:group I intron endonuclease
MNSLKITGIYKLTNVINGKIYIGQSKDIAERVRTHIKDCERVDDRRGRKALYDDMRKYGHENFKLEILEICDESELDEKEMYYIENYNATNEKIGYNRTKYAKPFQDPKIVAKSHSPRIMKMHGKRIRKWNLQQWQNPEYRKMKSEASSKLQKERLKDPEYHAEKTKQLKQATDKMKKQVAQYDKDGNLIAIYDGIREAGRQTGISHQTIQKVAKGDKYRKTAGGYVWKYLEEKV